MRRSCANHLHFINIPSQYLPFVFSSDFDAYPSIYNINSHILAFQNPTLHLSILKNLLIFSLNVCK